MWIKLPLLTEKGFKLLEYYKEILVENKGILLSGSLALRLADFKTRNRPHDLDIYLPHDVTFKPIEGMKMEKESDMDEDREYEEGDYTRVTWFYKGIKVDVFKPEQHVRLLSTWDYNSKIKCVAPLEILAFKLSHALGSSHSKYKHQKDLIYLFIQD